MTQKFTFFFRLSLRYTFARLLTVEDRQYIYYFSGLFIVVAITGLVLVIKSAFPAQPSLGFDLSNAPAGSPPAGVSVRRRRRGVAGIFFGLSLILMGISVPCFFGWMLATRTDPYAIKPYWWLRMNLESDDVLTTTFATSEMSRRFGNGQLSPQQTAALMERGLELQARGQLTQTWGSWVEAEHRAGRVSESDWQRYLSGGQWSLATLNHNSLVRGSNGYMTLFVTIRPQAGNVSQTLSQQATVSIPDLQMTLDDRPLQRLPDDSQRRHSYDPINFAVDPADVFTNFADGPHEARLRGTATVQVPGGPALQIPLDDAFAVSLQQLQWPADAFTHDPAAAEPIAAALHAELHATRITGAATQVELQLQVDSDKLPHDIGFNVFVCDPSPRAIGIMNCRKGGKANLSFNKASLDIGSEPTTADVLFLPLPTKGPDGRIEPIWDGGVRIKNVRIE